MPQHAAQTTLLEMAPSLLCKSTMPKDSVPPAGPGVLAGLIMITCILEFILNSLACCVTYLLKYLTWLWLN